MPSKSHQREIKVPVCNVTVRNHGVYKKNASFPDAKHGRNNGYQTLLISGPVLRIGVARTGAWDCWQVYAREPQKRRHLRKCEVFINFIPWKWGKSNSGTPSALRANTATQNAKPQDTPWKNTFEKIWANRNNSQTYKTTNFIAKLAHPTQNHFSWLFSRRILPFISKDSD